MKHLTTFCSAVTASCLLAFPLTCLADGTAESGSFLEAAVTCPEDVSVSRTTTLDYPADLLTMTYRFENNGSEDASCCLDIPVTTTLEDSQWDLYRFSVTNEDGALEDSETSLWFTPLFSSAGISEDSITAQALHDFRNQTASLPTDSGTLYTVSFDEVQAEPYAFLSVSTQPEGDCRIYPIGCSYSGKEGSYEISVSKDLDRCYVFITGEEGATFSAEQLGSGYDLTCEEAALDDFIDLSCDCFLAESPISGPVDKELLMQHLAVYLSSSNTTVSLDLVPSLQWLVRQDLFEVYSCEFTVKPGETVTASIVRNSELSVNAVSFNPALTNSGAPLVSNEIQVVFPEEYTRASFRMTRGSFDTETSTLTFKSAPADTYQIVLSKTPVWFKAYKYIIPMSAVMAVFLVLCVISYLGRRKSTPKDSADGGRQAK